ncbi:Ceramide glucosyltransferase [Dimargaris verticillata]|uniref:Ceramide glucosyltransferase n=1 Tax=Dimargaris verticillata TaxID=2761393 RepID=A0A9W8B4S0_9FUNG|nr:Ceramide glucosyltransferase [Dimargaris verticillata]
MPNWPLLILTVWADAVAAAAESRPNWTQSRASPGDSAPWTVPSGGGTGNGPAAAFAGRPWLSTASMEHRSLWNAVAYFGIFWWCVMVAFSVTGFWVTRRRYARPATLVEEKRILQHHTDRADTIPGVSVIRPLKGIDSDLRRCLESSFHQDYPKFEVVFTAEDASDPAIAVAKELMAQHPSVPARVVVSSQIVGYNPKINNIIDGVEGCKYDVLWMCDSNVYSEPGCLSRSVHVLTTSPSRVGIVHHIILATQPEGLGAWLEAMFINTVHAKMYLSINATGAASCVVGKSNVYFKRNLDALGGLKPFSNYMAEDNTIAQAFWKRGWKHRMTGDLAEQSLGRMTVWDYVVRRVRWTRTRKYNVTFATIVEPITESIVCGLLGAFAFHHLWQVPPTLFFPLHMVAWFLCDLWICTHLHRNRFPSQYLFVWAGVWLCRELFALPLYIFAVTGNTVAWRGRQFYLSTAGTITPLPAKSKLDDALSI